MCEKGEWEPFTVVEKEKGEPLHRCYQRCTAEGCTDIRVKLFNERNIETIGGGIDSFKSDVIDLEEDEQ